jgi:hypothetical protein
MSPAPAKDSVMIVSHHRAYRLNTDGQRMSARRMTRRASPASLRDPLVAEPRAGSGAARKPVELDAATLILELDLAALIGEAGDSLRQHSNGADQREPRSWWQRLVGKRRTRETRSSRQGGTTQ